MLFRSEEASCFLEELPTEGVKKERAGSPEHGKTEQAVQMSLFDLM